MSKLAKAAKDLLREAGWEFLRSAKATMRFGMTPERVEK
jgi:hypothetical protein